MESSIYKFVFRHSLRGQVVIIILTLISLPFTYYALDVPKEIINNGIEGKNVPETVFGYEVTQVQYLLLLCFLFLGLVVVNGAFKYVINVYKGVLGERLLRRFRYSLYERVLRFPLPHFKRLSQGEIIAMLTAETEPMGAFIGDAVSEPALQGGILLTYLFFIFNQDPILGAAAIVLYPVQMYLMPKLQRRVNALAKERVRHVRKVADRVGEGVAGVSEIHANATSRYERADLAARLGKIFEIRFEIYKRKFFIKFLNNFLATATPFLFYSAGGYFVIRGELSLGALVAVLAAYKDLNPPWKALLKYYQTKEDMRVKYEQVVEQFDPPGMIDQDILDKQAEGGEDFSQPITVSRVSLSEDGLVKTVESVTFEIGREENVAIVGPGGSGKQDLARLLGRLALPTSGQIRIGDFDLAKVPEPVLGRHMTYVDQAGFIFAGTVRHNLSYGLKQRPVIEPLYGAEEAEEHERWLAEMIKAGNSADNIEADWTDFELAGVESERELEALMLEALDAVQMREDVYQLGLRTQIDPERKPELVERFLKARRELRSRIEEQGLTDLIEPFDEEHYAENASVAENLLFGTPLDETFDVESLADNEYVIKVLKDVGLHDELVKIGQNLARTMVELFADLPPDHEFFEQFSFIRADDLPEYRALLSRVGDHEVGELSEADQRRLLALAFKLIPARHRLSLIDDELRKRIVEARHAFAANLPEHLRQSVAFFNSSEFNAAASLQDNILFGKLAHGAARGRERVTELIEKVLNELELHDDVTLAGLDYQVGISGGRLSAMQRQKLAIARALLKKPEIMVLNDATAAFDTATERHVMNSVLKWRPDARVIWALGRPELAEKFDRVLVLGEGTVVEEGTFAELKQSGTHLPKLVQSK